MRIFVEVKNPTSGLKIFTSGKIFVISGFAKSASWYINDITESKKIVSGSKKSTSGGVKPIFMHENALKRNFMSLWGEIPTILIYDNNM